MTSLEQALTDTFAGLAEEAPHDLGLLSRVQVASSRRTKVRRLSYGVSALAAVTAVAVGISVLPAGHAKADRFVDPTGFLVDNRDAEQRFPLSATFLPAGVRNTAVLDVYDEFGQANYYAGGGGIVVAFQDGPDAAHKGTPTTFQGKPALFECGATGCALSWQRLPHQYVTVSGDQPEAVIRQVAAGLADQPLVTRPKVVLGLVPASGCHLSLVLDTTTSYNPLGMSRACPLTVDVEGKGASAPAPEGGSITVIDSSVRIGGYDGTLAALSSDVSGQRRDFWYAVLDVPDGRKLVVTTPSDGGWDRDALDRFVRAIVLP